MQRHATDIYGHAVYEIIIKDERYAVVWLEVQKTLAREYPKRQREMIQNHIYRLMRAQFNDNEAAIEYAAIYEATFHDDHFQMIVDELLTLYRMIFAERTTERN